MPAWGFTYRSHLVWVKDRAGTGYWARSQHELLLIGTRGSVPAPSPGSQPASVIEAPVGRHSEKPPIFAEIIEALFPTLPRSNCSPARFDRVGTGGVSKRLINSTIAASSRTALTSRPIDKRSCVYGRLSPRPCGQRAQFREHRRHVQTGIEANRRKASS